MRITSPFRARASTAEQRAEVLELVVRPPEVVARAVLAQRVEVLVARVVEEGLEGLLARPFDEDHRLARLGAGALDGVAELAQAHDLPAVPADGIDRAAGVLAVEVVIGEVEEVEGVDGHHSVSMSAGPTSPSGQTPK